MDRKTTSFDVAGELDGLRRYALALTRNQADAEDLVQDTLVRAYQARGGFRPGGKLRSWLMSILHNTFVDRYRTREAEQRRDRSAAELLSEAQPPRQEESLRLAQLRAAFMLLPDAQREAMHLVAIEGLSYEEASTVLGVPAGTVMSRVARAREALRNFEDGDASVAPHLRLVGGRHDQ